MNLIMEMKKMMEVMELILKNQEKQSAKIDDLIQRVSNLEKSFKNLKTSLVISLKDMIEKIENCDK